MQQRLIIFTRFPEPGKTKTRLIPALGNHGAAVLSAQLTRRTLDTARRFADASPVTLEVCFAGGNAEQMAAYFGNGISYHRQAAGDLGHRMKKAFASAFQQGAERVVIIGSDCPEITPKLLGEAFARLNDCDVVLGPAADGGYYLIGLRRPVPQLFDNIPWGSELVGRATLCLAEELSLAVFQLAVLSDVDRPEDLDTWRRVQQSAAAARGMISVIIPTLNEAEHLLPALLSVKGSVNVETIIVDGGSTDGTPEIAERAGFRVFSSPPGRARQMNTGAALASGTILLFLHADTRLPERFARLVHQVFDRPKSIGRLEPVAGAFRLRIDGDRRALRWIELGVNLRSRLFHFPYGDQALFLKAHTFHHLGGFADLPVMEDFELVRRLRKLGRITILPSSVVTSARRWQSAGAWRTTWLNQKMILGFLLGVSPARLAQWYGNPRDRSQEGS